MIEWYKKVVFQNYANFNGRARRSEFWYFALVNFIISLVLNTGLGMISPSLALVGSVYSLAVLAPAVGVGIRRMHDIGKSGWYILIPLYNIYLWTLDGEPGSNEYGSNPKNSIDGIGQA